MKKMMFLASILALSTFPFFQAQGQVILTFEGITPDPSIFGGYTPFSNLPSFAYTESGFVVSILDLYGGNPDNGGFRTPESFGASVDDTNFLFSNINTYTVQRIGNGLFDFNDVQMFNPPANGDVTLTFNGYVGGTLMDSTTFTATAGNVSTSAPEAGFTGVDTLTISVPSVGNGFALDNLRLTPAPVPEPTTSVLLGCGLIGLILLRKRVAIL
jgi:hypothetical protein